MVTVVGIALTTNPNSEIQHALSAVITFAVVFLINFAGFMVQFSAVPTADQLWTPFWQSFMTALVIYAINKGIQYSYDRNHPQTTGS